MALTILDLFIDLKRLEDELGRLPRANDVVRDGAHSVNTYYKRFDGNWRHVETAYRQWRETGRLPADAP
ncbi:homing endonuclease associated repeat-containing protein [Halomarina halobia]|uniref:Homing endonuclease associated repeat-containing protein n=2 Tax=Halomarina halobia TaxID=3033386 RepID=A0ABD6ACW5_9EURY|nr:hypothetical protein [Halomarina sp. PSR21]